jgi:hypothetical protein
VMWNGWQSVMDRPELYRSLAAFPRFLLHDVLRGQWSPQIPIWGKDRSGPEMSPESFAEMYQKEFGA